MATFVLVHGAWGGGWVYKGVAKTLRDHGHDVYVATLTGLGERAHLASPAIDLSTHIRDVVNLIRYESLSDIILCGHSYGGMVITGVAGTIGERIRTLFYLDAFLAGDGQSLWDIADEDAHRHYIDSQREVPGMCLPFQESRRTDGEPPHANRHPLLTLIEPLKLNGSEKHVRNRTYVCAMRNAPTPFTGFFEGLQGDAAWKLETADTGHMVMTDDPERLVQLLLEEIDR
jgi:pimeloyl-ACP methyl ester carboxylesterase